MYRDRSSAPFAGQALLLSCFKATRASAVAGAVAALCVDALTFHSVFIRPTSSAASLALLFSPLWNFLIGQGATASLDVRGCSGSSNLR